MSRVQRKQSSADIYHVMVRGINQLQLFYDDDDRQAFLDRLERLKDDHDFKLYAWSLMGNHVHLLIGAPLEDLGALMKSLLLSYSHLYNNKYDRSGYLYQDRFKSKPVEDDAYFLEVLRYIHRNPLEIGETPSFWTSYGEYVGEGRLADTEMALGMLSENADTARKMFKDLIARSDDGSAGACGFGRRQRRTDREAADLIEEAAGVSACQDVSALDRDSLAVVVPKLRSEGLSVRQIARLTGLNRGIVERLRPE